MIAFFFIFAISLNNVAADDATILPLPSQAWQQFLKPIPWAAKQEDVPLDKVVEYFKPINNYGGKKLVVKQIMKAQDTCIKMMNQRTIFDDYMYKPMYDGILTFYLHGVGGACGINCDKWPIMSAAASTEFFSKNGWLKSCLPNNPDGTPSYVNPDRVCDNRCAQITYKGKTVTVPITNSCPGCPKNHLDLSVPTWLWLEPNYRIGRLFNATIMFMYCP
uniref:Expansin-like EG45 domain-containing protein n=1 Tax=Meloidogyne enterolobii TaxID=390850 RepID=A0A6V7VJL8_MELEN|nr:unnamed protein product [Meloidogyne enterolobii]